MQCDGLISLKALYKTAKYSWKTQEVSIILLSSFEASSVTKYECLNLCPAAGAGLLGTYSVLQMSDVRAVALTAVCRYGGEADTASTG